MTHAIAVKTLDRPAETSDEAKEQPQEQQPGRNTVAVPVVSSVGDAVADRPAVGLDAIRRPASTGADDGKQAETQPAKKSYAEMTAGEMTTALAGGAEPGSIVTIDLSVLPTSMQAFIKRLHGLLDLVDTLDLDDLPAVTQLRNKIKTGARSWHQDGLGRIPKSPNTWNHTRVKFFLDFMLSADKPLPTKQMKKGIDGIERPLREYTAMGWKEAEQSGRLIYDPLADVFYLTCQHYVKTDIYFRINAPRAAKGGGGDVAAQVSREEFELLLFQAWEEVAIELQAFLDARARKKAADALALADEAPKDTGKPATGDAKGKRPSAKPVPSSTPSKSVSRGAKGHPASSAEQKRSAEEIRVAEREAAQLEAAKVTATKLGNDSGMCVIALDEVRRSYVAALTTAKAAVSRKAEAAERKAQLESKMAKFNAPKKGGAKDEKKAATPEKKSGGKGSSKGGKAVVNPYVPDEGGTFTYKDREWAIFEWKGATFLVDSVDAYIGYYDHNGVPTNDPYPEETTIGDLAQLFRLCLKGAAVADKPTAIMLAGLVAEPIRHPTAALEALFAVIQSSPFPSSTKAFKGEAMPMTTGGTIGSGGVPTDVMYSEAKSAKRTIDAVLKDAEHKGDTLFEQLGHLGPAQILAELKMLLFLALGDPTKRFKAVQARDKTVTLPVRPLPVEPLYVATPVTPTEQKADDPSPRGPALQTEPAPEQKTAVAIDPDSKPDPSMAPSSKVGDPRPESKDPGTPSAALDATVEPTESKDLGTTAPQISPAEVKSAIADPVQAKSAKSGSSGPIAEQPYQPKGDQQYPTIGLMAGGNPEPLPLQTLEELLGIALQDPNPKAALEALAAHLSWQIAEMESDPMERASWADGGEVSKSYPKKPNANMAAFTCWQFYRHVMDYHDKFR